MYTCLSTGNVQRVYQKLTLGWGYNSVSEHLPGMHKHKALGWLHETMEKADFPVTDIILQLSALRWPCPYPLLWSFSKAHSPLLWNRSNSIASIWFKIFAWQVSWKLSVDLWWTDFHQLRAQLMFLVNCFATDWFSVSWESLNRFHSPTVFSPSSELHSQSWKPESIDSHVSLPCDALNRFQTLRPELCLFRFLGCRVTRIRV